MIVEVSRTTSLWLRGNEASLAVTLRDLTKRIVGVACRALEEDLWRTGLASCAEPECECNGFHDFDAVRHVQ
jgi:hypothetical protein